MTTEKPQKTFAEKLNTFDKRYIFVLLFILVSIPILRPIGFPLVISSDTLKAYSIISDIPAGSAVVFDYECDTGGLAELQPIFIVVAKQLRAMDVRIIAVSWWGANNGGLFADVSLHQVWTTQAEWDADYGTKFVNLGYIAGGETGIRAFATNVKMVEYDQYGNPTANMPVMQGLNTASDLAVVISFPWIVSAVTNPLNQFVAPGYTKVIEAVTSVMRTSVTPFLETGSLSAVIAGLTGAAEYEHLTGALGTGSLSMDAQTLAHILVISLIIVGNVGFAYTVLKRRAGIVSRETQGGKVNE